MGKYPQAYTPMPPKPLTDAALKRAKPTLKPQRIFDGGGLYVEISPAGGKLWRLKYRFGWKEKRLALGKYTEISLADERERRDAARKLLANRIDPSEHRKAGDVASAERAANSFEVVARAWHSQRVASGEWVTAHADKILTRLERDIFPWVGARPIAEIKPLEMLKTIRRIEARGARETAHRAFENCGCVFRYAITEEIVDSNPLRDLRRALLPAKAKNRAAITDPAAVGALLRAIDGYQGAFVTKCALEIAPIVFVRPGELRNAEWSEIDMGRGVWTIPAGKMKMRMDHMVPLATQALDILRDLHPLTGRSKYVFPGARSDKRPMSNNAVLAALRRMGFTSEEMSGHGFRAMARTILDEVLGVRVDFIEHQLAHAVKDPNGRAYNRTAHLAERKKMMQQWADYLDSLRCAAI